MCYLSYGIEQRHLMLTRLIPSSRPRLMQRLASQSKHDCYAVTGWLLVMGQAWPRKFQTSSLEDSTRWHAWGSFGRFCLSMRQIWANVSRPQLVHAWVAEGARGCQIGCCCRWRLLLSPGPLMLLHAHRRLFTILFCCAQLRLGL